MSGSAQRKNFDSLAENGKVWLEWIEEGSRFEGVVKQRIDWGNTDNRERSIIQARLKSGRPEKQVLLNSLYVTMVAGFEEFLRSWIKSIAVQLTNRKKKHTAYSREAILLNIRESAKLLRRIDSPPDYLQFSEEALCQVLGSCVAASDEVKFNGEALSEIEGLLKLENFFDRVSFLFVKIDFDILGNDADLKKSMNLKKSASQRETGKLLSEELINVSRNRNRIAHTGGSASDVTEQVLIDHRKLLCSVVAAIDGLLHA